MTNDNRKTAGAVLATPRETVHDIITGLQYLSLLATASDVPRLSPILDKALKSCLGAAKDAYGPSGRKFLADLADDLSENENFVDAVCRIRDPEKRRQLFQMVQAEAKK